MTIYLPYPDFRRSAKCLTDEHLRLQRNWIRSAIHALTVPGRLSLRVYDIDIGAWDGHMRSLLFLCEATLDERKRRGIDERGVTPWMLDHGEEPPAWLGDPAFHDEQKRKLLHLAPSHYGKMGWRLS